MDKQLQLPQYISQGQGGRTFAELVSMPHESASDEPGSSTANARPYRGLDCFQGGRTFAEVVAGHRHRLPMARFLKPHLDRGKEVVAGHRHRLPMSLGARRRMDAPTLENQTCVGKNPTPNPL